MPSWGPVGIVECRWKSRVALAGPNTWCKPRVDGMDSGEPPRTAVVSSAPVQPGYPTPPPGYGYGYGPDRGSVPGRGSRPSQNKQGRSGAGVLVGVGCLLLLVLAVVGGVGIYLATRDKRSTSGPETPVLPSAGSVVARDLRDFVSPRGGIVFVAELVNTGSTAVAPLPRLRLLDAQRAEVASVPCPNPPRLLGPGEKAPCAFSFAGARSSFASSDVVVEARAATAREVRLTASNVVLGRSFATQLTGTVANPAAVTVRNPQVVATVYGVDGKIVGAATLDLKKELGAGASSPFVVVIPDVAALPKTFAVRAVGTPD